MGEILLRADKIDKHFGITHALDHVSLTFEKGEIHALIRKINPDLLSDRYL